MPNLNIKEELLKCKIVVDNEYLDEYVSIVENNLLTRREVSKTNKHHIIPRYFYKSNGIDVNNSSDNVVNLLYVDHIKAHYYLAKCSSTEEYEAFNVHSIRYLLNGKDISEFDISDINFDDIQKLYEKGRKYTFKESHSIEACKKVSDSLIGRASPNKGNFKNGVCRAAAKSCKNPNAKNKKLSEIASMRFGEKNSFYGHKHTEEFKNKLSVERGFPVEMVDLKTKEVLNVFPSASMASKFLYNSGIVKTKQAVNRILIVCKENNPDHKAYGYNWRFSKKCND